VSRPIPPPPPTDEPPQDIFAHINEAELLQHFEAQRRQGLLAIIVPLFAILSGLFALMVMSSMLVFVSPSPSLLTIMGIAGAYALSQFVLWLLLRHKAISISGAALFASGALTAALGSIGLTLTVFTSDQVVLGIILWGVCCASIVLAGALNGRIALLAAALVAEVGAALGFTNPVIQQSYIVPLLTVVLYLPAIAGLTFAIQRNYQQSFREYNMLYTQLQQVDEVKNLFITSVNHEMRNPVMVMQGYIMLVRQLLDSAPPERLQDVLARAQLSGERTLALISSILEVQRMDLLPEKYTPEPVNIRRALDAAIDLINPREGDISGRVVQFDVPAQLAVMGEPIRVQQIFSNLLSNAAKYSPANTPIIVRARSLPFDFAGADAAKGPMVEITVRDFGLGIPPTQAGLLFRRFVRLPRDITSKVVGNGLGLNLCKSLAEALGGAIRFESSGVEGEGTTFFVTLPAPSADSALPISAAVARTRVE
jgi:signal transduction histidine kinase